MSARDSFRPAVDGKLASAAASFAGRDSNNGASSVWIASQRLNPRAALRLFCLPYAGGGTAIFSDWRRYLPGEVDLVPVSLPGRERRMREAPLNDLLAAAKAISHGILPFLDRPFAFFGHSMGALLVFELAHEVRRFGFGPVRLFVSACCAPHVKRESPLHHKLPHDDFVKQLRTLDGTPREILDSKESLAMFLPLLRADLQMVDLYAYKNRAPLTCPITALYGTEDREATCKDVQLWREHTSGGFSLCAIPGNHFFVKSETPILLELLTRQLCDLVGLQSDAP